MSKTKIKQQYPMSEVRDIQAFHLTLFAVEGSYAPPPPERKYPLQSKHQYFGFLEKIRLSKYFESSFAIKIQTLQNGIIEIDIYSAKCSWWTNS